MPDFVVKRKKLFSCNFYNFIVKKMLSIFERKFCIYNYLLISYRFYGAVGYNFYKHQFKLFMYKELLYNYANRGGNFVYKVSFQISKNFKMKEFHEKTILRLWTLFLLLIFKLCNFFTDSIKGIPEYELFSPPGHRYKNMDLLIKTLQEKYLGFGGSRIIKCFEEQPI